MSITVGAPHGRELPGFRDLTGELAPMRRSYVALLRRCSHQVRNTTAMNMTARNAP
jgi:hypothetical protein